MEKYDQWIIGGLVVALSAVLWFVLLDTRTETHNLMSTAVTNTGRISILETRVNWLEKTLMDLQLELHEHRRLMEDHQH